MRRKSGRNVRKPSPEKTKPEPAKNSRKHNSRRHKSSTSRSSDESEEEATHTPDMKKHGQETAQDQSNFDKNKSHNDTKNIEEKSTNSPSRGRSKVKSKVDDSETKTNRGQSRGTPEKDNNEEVQEQEGSEESKNKGKSKGINKSKIEHSWNNIEPEIENENVQGTPQSPSNDNADNENVVQNVTDTPQSNLEDQVGEGNCQKGCEVLESNEQHKDADPVEAFESEYVQECGSNQKQSSAQNNQLNNSEKNSSRRNSVQLSHEEKSTTPEPRGSDKSSKNRGSTSKEKNNSRNEISGDDKNKSRNGKDKSAERESLTTRKKITLRRSPPASRDRSTERTSHKERRSTTEDSGTASDVPERKSAKKITLKRSTSTVERSTNNEKQDRDAVARRRSIASDELSEHKRRLSSVSEDKSQQDLEDKPKKIFKKVKLIRNNFLINKGEDERPPTRKCHTWGTSEWLDKISSTLYKVDVDSLKVVCPNLKFLNESEVRLEAIPRERTKSEGEVVKRKISIDRRSDDSERPEYEKQTSEDSTSELKVEHNPNIIALNRKISIVDDTASKLRPPPSPAKHPVSEVLFITNLVRPFTVKQLRELLERTGKINTENFWTDRIKSKCYVQYETAQEAEATRNALHGVNWPIGNGKKLIIDYATVEDLEKAKNPAPPPIVVPEKLPEKENREPERFDEKHQERDREDRKMKDGYVREWDMGKEAKRRGRSRSRSRSRERARKHSRRSYTPDDYLNKKHRKVDESVPQKLMDDLFLKTKATPSIYWQPLSPEEIATKQQQRLVRMEEHKRRIEETRGRGRDSRRGPFRRR